MRAHNLSPDTYVQPRDVARFKEAGIDMTEIVVRGGDDDSVLRVHHFVKASVHEGMIPRIAGKLLDMRSLVKKEMKRESDGTLKAILDSKQKALKVLANSLYGVTAASNGYLRLMAVAESTTAIGRCMLEDTRDGVEQRFTRENGFPCDAHTVYGDTDSVMVHLKGLSESVGFENAFDCAFDLGDEMGTFITAGVFGPYDAISIKLEEVSLPTVFCDRKKSYYMNLKEFKAQEHPHRLVKGLDVVRRNVAPVSKKIQTELLDVIMPTVIPDRPKDGEELEEEVLACAATWCRKILNNELPVSDFVLSGTLRDSYKCSPPAHAVVAQRLREEIAAGTVQRVPPRSGERIFYVIRAGPGKKVSLRAQDPDLLEERGERVDAVHYLGLCSTAIGKMTSFMSPEARSKLEAMFSAKSDAAQEKKRADKGFGNILSFVKPMPASPPDRRRAAAQQKPKTRRTQRRLTSRRKVVSPATTAPAAPAAMQSKTKKRRRIGGKHLESKTRAEAKHAKTKKAKTFDIAAMLGR